MADVNDDIVKYLKGELTPAEMHALEKKALDDPFLADALDGGGAISSDELSEDLHQLQHALKKKTAKKGGSPLTWNLPMRIAASVLFLAASTFIIYNLVENSDVREESLALNKDVEQGNAGIDSAARKEPIPETEATQPPTNNEPNAIDQSAEGIKHSEPTAKPSSQAKSSTQAPEGKVPTPLVADVVEEDEVISDEDVLAQDVTANESPGKETQELNAQRQELARVQQAPDKADSVIVRIRGYATSPPAVDKKEKATTTLKTIRGKVTDVDDGLPLPGVNVLSKESTAGAITDLNGNYEITLPQSSESLIFSYIGMEVKEIDLPESDKDQSEENIDVQLTPDVSQLSEVVVTGYSSEDGKEFEGTKWDLAEPVGGRKEYEEYLKKNLLYPQVAIENKVEGKVTIQFTVQPSGQLTDFRVVKSLGFGCDEEVIRLIQEGPTWRPTRRNDEPVKGKAKVKMRFSLKDKKD